MRFARGLVLVLAATLLLGAGAAHGQGPNPPGLAADISGVVPALDKAHNDASGVSGFGRLYYHSGGSVMPTNTSYAIYWDPARSMSSSYRDLVDRFLGDVAADSGKTSNVYWSDTQYYQTIGGATTYVRYASSFAGSVVDTNPYPASGCADSVAQTSVCLSDAQLRAEISRVISSTPGWSAGPARLFFLFTPKGVGSCYNASNCAFSQFCAYHSHFGSGASVTLYANQPYTDTVPAACDIGQHPNGDEADPTINVVSHEHNETITDALGNAWYDLAGYENGDKCAWNFGAALGSSGSGLYNQLINGHPYYLQQEYSNAHRNCVLTGT